MFSASKSVLQVNITSIFPLIYQTPLHDNREKTLPNFTKNYLKIYTF